MSHVSFDIGTHGIPTTAREMRKRLARALSKIPGDQIVSFNLTLHMNDFVPAKRNLGMPAVLGAPYSFALAAPVDLKKGLWGYASSICYGELARPEND